MSDVNKLNRERTYEIADALAQASSQILERRIELRLTQVQGNEKTQEQREMDEKDQRELEQCENHLDQMVAMFRAYGIHLLAEAAQDPIASIKDAIADATQNLKTIKNIKHNVMTAARLVDLAATILSRDPIAMFEAAKSLQTSLRRPASEPI
ncbi:hypothetical protein [Janthinobacterium sp. PSPC2-1]|uniref:hypothetical protein n=1 Tax=unclassified Janthinobacterium TaxID=2610881 RepID=UPI003CEFB8D7